MDRITAARARLDEAAAVAKAATMAGPPCSECRFRTFSGACGNPAYAAPRFSPVTGEYSERFNVALDAARSDDGLCGPEALLFEPHGVVIPVARGFWTGAKIGWVTLLFGIIAFMAFG